MAKPPSPHAGHRERLRARLLKSDGEGLADYEVLEFLLFGARARGDTKPLAKALIKQFGSLAAALNAHPDELRSVKGISDAAIGALKIVPIAARAMAKEEVMNQPVLNSWERLIGWCRIELGHRKVEEFHLLFLNTKNLLIHHEVQGRGTVNHTPVYVREIAKRALDLGATALIMVHNHPSGDPKPSKTDIAMTRQVKDALEKLSIALHDHLIITKSGHVSFKAKGLI